MTRLQQELSRKARSLGCTAKYDESDESLKIEYGDAEICTVKSAGQIHYKGADELTEEQNEVLERLERQVDTIKEYLSAYDSAPQFDIDGISDYRKLAEFYGVVFGAKDMGEHGFQFSSWFKTQGGTGATMGNYSFDYEASKQNFAFRSGLTPKQRFFTDEQLESLYRCLSYTAQTDESLTYNLERSVGDLMNKIEGILPKVNNNSEYQFNPDENNTITMN